MVLNNKGHNASAVSEAAGAGRTIFELAPRNKAAQEYLALAQTLDAEA